MSLCLLPPLLLPVVEPNFPIFSPEISRFGRSKACISCACVYISLQPTNAAARSTIAPSPPQAPPTSSASHAQTRSSDVRDGGEPGRRPATAPHGSESSVSCSSCREKSRFRRASMRPACRRATGSDLMVGRAWVGFRICPTPPGTSRRWRPDPAWWMW